MKKLTNRQKVFLDFLIKYNYNKDEAYGEVFNNPEMFEHYSQYEEVIEWHFEKEVEEEPKAENKEKKQSRPRLVGNHIYKIIDHNYSNEECLATFIGRQEEFECMVCGKGHNAYCFNIFMNEEDLRNNENYETWAYGKEHLPEIIEDITKEYK